MRHRVSKPKLASDKEHMKSLLGNLSTELILKEKLETTLAKAKALRPHIERLVTYAGKAFASSDKVKIFNASKELAKKVHSDLASKKLLNEISERFVGTPGGYTRIVKIGNRDGDKAEMARIEFTKSAKPVAKTEKATKAKVKKTTKNEK